LLLSRRWRFAAGHRYAGDRLGWGSALRLATRRNPAWTGGFGGFRSFCEQRTLAVLVAFEVVQGGPKAFTRVTRASLCSEPQPSLSPAQRRPATWSTSPRCSASPPF